MMFKNNNSVNAFKAESPEKAHSQPSKTTPDMTLSIKDILKRHASGQNITTLQPEYQANDEFDELLANIGNMDEMSRLDLARKLKTQGTTMVKDLEKSIAATNKIKADKEAIKKAEYDAWVASQIPPTGEGEKK